MIQRGKIMPLTFLLTVITFFLVLFSIVFYKGFFVNRYFEFYDFIFHNHERVVFVGDVMLARNVEELINQYGKNYPFTNINHLFENKTVVGNFEASVPEMHVPTSHMEFSFSVDKRFLSSLYDAGFDYFSLANNHSYDYGSLGFLNTEKELNQYNMKTFGDSKDLALDAVEYITVNGLTVALVGIDLVNKNWSEVDIQILLKRINISSDKQVVYVHWGEEYQDVHDSKQEKYAEYFIDNGADLVIGHHPHVVQDVSMVNGVPVFYSLGNFIFDQYFSSSVMEGLAIDVLFLDNKSEVILVPITTKGSHAQPQVMSLEESELFFTELAQRSHDSLYDYILEGRLSF